MADTLANALVGSDSLPLPNFCLQLVKGFQLVSTFELCFFLLLSEIHQKTDKIQVKYRYLNGICKIFRFFHEFAKTKLSVSNIREWNGQIMEPRCRTIEHVKCFLFCRVLRLLLTLFSAQRLESLKPCG